MFEVMGLVFTGAEVKRNRNDVPGQVDVDIAITKITKKDRRNMVLEFSYTVDYKPNVAKLKMTGNAYCVDTPENVKKAMAAFKKRKRLPMEYGATVLNMINANAGLNSVFIIRPFNLLPPFMPPLISEEFDISKGKIKKVRKK